MKYRKYSNDEERWSGCNANFLIEIIFRGHSKLATPRNATSERRRLLNVRSDPRMGKEEEREG